MDAAPSTEDLLRSFDAESCAPQISLRRVPTRGIRWVLKWFAAIGVLAFAAGTLLEFFYVMAAERTLARAARAGALEATLPRATLVTITDTVHRRFAAYPRAPELRIVVENNGKPILGPLQPRQGDRLSVTLAASTDDVLPAWLRTLRFWDHDKPIRVRMERVIPGRAVSRGRESSTRPAMLHATN